MVIAENMLWKRSQVGPNDTLQAVIQNLDVSGLQIVLVIDKDAKLLGTITDGDVRRALLRNIPLSSSAATVMFQSPLVVTQDMPREMVLTLMQANKIHHLPVVDQERRVVGLQAWDEIVAPSRDSIILIMAGGFGKRLRPFTDDCPKPMLPVAGRPILEHIIERARAEGFFRFVLSLHYLGKVIQDYFGDGTKFGVEINYLSEDVPLGTAGALSLLDPVPNLPLIVTNGDVLTDIRYGEMLDFHVHHEADATMAVRSHEWQHPFGVVKTKGIEIVGFEEKPVHRSHVNAGIYVLNPSALTVLVKNELCDMPTLFERLQAEGCQTIAYPMHEPWLDVGRPEDLRRANQLGEISP